MIKKLLVLNGTEGHKFEVGKQYFNTDDPQIVMEIKLFSTGHQVIFENGDYVVIESPNVMIFYSR